MRCVMLPGYIIARRVAYMNYGRRQDILILMNYRYDARTMPLLLPLTAPRVRINGPRQQR